MISVFLLLIVYLIQLLIGYNVLRKVYINKSHLVGIDDLVMFAVPMIGIGVIIAYVPYLPKSDGKARRRLLDKIFFVGKQKKF